MFYTSHTRRNRILIALTLAICTAAIAESQSASVQKKYIGAETSAEKAPAMTNLDHDDLIERMDSNSE